MNAMPDIEAIRAQVAAKRQELAEAHGTEAKPEEPGKTRKFRLVSAGDLCANPAKAAWLIRDFIELDSLAALFGPSAAMKSFIALDWACCVATGRDWNGHKTAVAGPVVYVAGEGFAGLNKRIRAWCIHNKVEPGQLPLYVSTAPVAMLDPESLAEAKAEIDTVAQASGAPRLIILDTLARNYGCGDENSNSDMGRFVAGLDDLRTSYGCCVLTIHHTGHGEANRARGASAFRAALDSEFRLEPKGEVRLLVCSKSKDHEAPDPMAFEPEVVDLGLVDDEGVPLSSVVMVETDVPTHDRKDRPLKGAGKIAYDALISTCTKPSIMGDRAVPVDIETWRTEAYRLSISPSNEQGAKQRAFHRALSSLRDSGHVLVEDELYWPASLPRHYPDKTRQLSGHYPDRPDNNPLGLSGCLDVCPDRQGRLG